MTPHRPVRRALALLVATLATSSFLAACGDDDEPVTAEDATTTTFDDVSPGEAIEVTGVWARTSASVATAGAVYLTITNGGDADDALLSASVDPSVAAKTEVHETVEAASDTMSTDTTMGEESSETTEGGDMSTETTMAGGMMTMQPVDRIPVPAGESVALEPGGYHIMLMELAAPLEVGSTIEVTLVFEAAGEVVVTAEVRDVAP
jgi:hypothetical protein